jgi:transcriptional accessory protein Tex/SPT6
VKQDGLLHKSEYDKDDKFRVGDVIKVKIKMIDIDRGRIGLAK